MNNENDLPKRKIENTEALNRKQDIIILNQKSNQKYGYYAEIRRQTIGIINSYDLQIINKNNLTNIIEKSIINAPDYWLTYAMSALAYWFMDEESKCDMSVKKSLELNKKNSSLFYSLINAKYGREKASTIWLKKYLESVNPNKTNSELIVMINALTSYNYGKSNSKLIFNKANEWKNIIKQNIDEYNAAKDIWIKFYQDNIVENSGESFPYLKTYSLNFNDVVGMLSISDTNDKIFESIKRILDEKTISSSKDVIVDLINNLEKEELEINEKIKENESLLNGEIYDVNYENDNLLVYLSKLLINNKIDYQSENSKKIIFSLIKDVVIESYSEFKEVKMAEELMPITIKINEWTSETIDASNEKELHESLHEYMKPTMLGAIKESNYFTFTNIIVLLLLIFLSVYFKNEIILSIALCVLACIFIILSIIYTDKKKKGKKEINANLDTELDSLLNNIMAEVVDYSRLWKISNARFNNIIKYLNGINENAFINTKTTSEYDKSVNTTWDIASENNFISRSDIDD